LATSGLDHDVKIWAPLAKEPNDLSGLEKLIETNRHDREDDRLRPHDPISEHLIYLMMHHVHQRLRVRKDQDNKLLCGHPV
jgi:WD repeat-containing protein 42A